MMKQVTEHKGKTCRSQGMGFSEKCKNSAVSEWDQGDVIVAWRPGEYVQQSAMGGESMQGTEGRLIIDENIEEIYIQINRERLRIMNSEKYTQENRRENN